MFDNATYNKNITTTQIETRAAHSPKSVAAVSNSGQKKEVN
jgi:hypothetical protein